MRQPLHICARPMLHYLIPSLDWLSKYNKTAFSKDLQAGLTVGVLLVPQSMAYALLAGVPPIYGLYSGIVPLLIYGILGTSMHLSIGPVAVSALLVLAGVGQVAEPFSDQYLSLVILAGLMIGVAQMLMGFLRLGFLVNFLSHPVIAGFTSAAAVIIAASQLKYLFGFDIPRFEHFYETVGYAFSNLDKIHWLSFIFAISGMALISILKN